MSDLLWSRSDHLLEAGSDLLCNFPAPGGFHFGSAFDRNPQKSRRVELRPLQDDMLNIRKRIGKDKPRLVTAHSHPFHRATLRGDHDLMKLLLRGNTFKEIDMRDGNLATALHIAVEQGDLAAVKILVEAGSSLSLKDYETPLHTAIRMDHTDIVRYLIEAGASLEVCDSDRRTAMDLSMRKITTNDKFANGILRPITGVKIIGEGSSAIWDKEIARKLAKAEAKAKEKARRMRLHGKYNSKHIRSGSCKHTTQLYEEVRDMHTWDYGKSLLFEKKLADKKKQISQKLGRVILKNDLTEAKEILAQNPDASIPDTNDRGRAPLTYASMFATPDTVKWLVNDVGVHPREQDVKAAHQCGKGKNVNILKGWPVMLEARSRAVELRVKEQYEEATALRAKEAAAKQGLEFLRGLLRDGKVQHGKRFEHRLIQSLDALEACPLGPAADFLELGRIVRELLPDAWGKNAWASYRRALVAARSKAKSSVRTLRKQGDQGDLNLEQQPGQSWINDSASYQNYHHTVTTMPLMHPSPDRDYSGMVGVSRVRSLDERTGIYRYER